MSKPISDHLGQSSGQAATVQLPEPAVLCDCGGNYYTADQLRAAVLAERERCAKECERHTTHPDDPTNSVWMCAYNHVAGEIAAAIRRGPEKAE